MEIVLEKPLILLMEGVGKESYAFCLRSYVPKQPTRDGYSTFGAFNSGIKVTLLRYVASIIFALNYFTYTIHQMFFVKLKFF